MRGMNKRLTPLLVIAMLFTSLAACGTGPAAEHPDTKPGIPAGDRVEAPSSQSSAPASEAPTTEMGDDSPAVSLQGSSLEQFFEESWRELSLRDPERVLADGLAEAYDLEGAQLTDISDTYVRETYEMYGAVLDSLHTYDRDQLSPEQQISYDVYEWYLDDKLREQEFMYYDYPATFYPITAVHLEMIHFFTDLHPVANQQDAEDYVARLWQVGDKFEQLLEGLKLREDAGIIPPRFAIEWGLYGLRNLTRANPKYTPFYETFKERVAALDDVGEAEKEALQKEAEKAIKDEVLPAYKDLMAYLEHLEGVARTKDGVWQFRGGDEYYDYLLHYYTTTDLAAEEIHELGKKELARIHEEMRTIFDDLGYPQDESLPELFDRVALDGGSIEAGQILETYNSIIDEAGLNLDAAFDLRPKADVIVVNSSIKGMYVSASLDGTRPGALHAGPGDGPEQYYAMPTLAYHEAVPGHHFQIALAQESDLPTFRNVVGFTGYDEGWALYAERLASELGWYEDDAYGNLGRLQAEAFRAARLVVDTGIHAKRWDFDRAMEFFVENTGYELGDAVNPEIEIARYIVWPGQSTSYKVGMLKILELRQRAMDQLGDQFDLKEFHNVVLGNGSMPLDVLERVVDDYIEASLRGVRS